MCITSCLSASASKHVCSPCMSWPFRGLCVCGNRYVHPGKASQPTTLQGGRGGVGGLCPPKLLPIPQETYLLVCAWAPLWAAGGTFIAFILISLRATSFLRVWRSSRGRNFTPEGSSHLVFVCHSCGLAHMAKNFLTSTLSQSQCVCVCICACVCFNVYGVAC